MLDLDSGGARVSVDIDTPDAPFDIDDTARENDQKGGQEGVGGTSVDLGSILGTTDTSITTEDTSQDGDDDDDDDVNDLYATIEIGQLAGKFNFYCLLLQLAKKVVRNTYALYMRLYTQ